MRIVFLTPLIVSGLQDGRNWQLEDLFEYTEDGVTKTIPKGRVTDFASIPSFSRVGGVVTIIGLAACELGYGKVGLCLSAAGLVLVFLADSFNNDPLLDKPAVVHDEDYNQVHRSGIYWVTDKLIADYKLFVSMKETKRSLAKRLIVYGGVTVGGWWPWYVDGVKAKKQLAMNPPPVVS